MLYAFEQKVVIFNCMVPFLQFNVQSVKAMIGVYDKSMCGDLQEALLLLQHTFLFMTKAHRLKLKAALSVFGL